MLSIFSIQSSSQLRIREIATSNGVALVSASQETFIYTDSTDDWLIQKSAQLLQQDIKKVTNQEPIVIHALSAAKGNLIIIGSLLSSITIQHLNSTKKIEISKIKGQWEAYSISTVHAITPFSKNAVVVVGSDKRGTAYGVFELSKQIGVSPWYWWADVPVKKKREIYIEKGVYNYDTPSVKYRGIFINDEAPAFSGWVKEKFGGVNHWVYEKIFELLLRLKANYLWPAMWGNAFNDDDTLNPILADKYGIVMGTSHHEPMMRAQQEWKRYGHGAWDYTQNDSALRSFWHKGIVNMKSHESIITIGMRGDGDMPMVQGTATALLEKIVADQRKIIEDVTKRPAKEQPQLWALYKEVQDYYDKGMRVPDDVTLLLCDDNWGNIRKLPRLDEPKRGGGYGMYYHFDYVGGPRNYKWINTNNIPRVWEQMHLAYSYGVDQIWVVNVGDIKPMEMPISFFLEYAYDVKKWDENNILQFYVQWAEQQFGRLLAKPIGKILERYTQFSSVRKPELLNASIFSLQHYNEFESVVNQWEELQKEAESIYQKIDAAYKDAYFQLVLHPVKAQSILYHLYYNVALNQEAAKIYRSNTNLYADKAKAYFQTDSLLSVEYNQLNNGKWHHMMDQTHIGYFSWQEPRSNKMPLVKYIPMDSIRLDINVERNKDVSAGKFIPYSAKKNAFFELNGVVSINAEDFTKANGSKNIEWRIIPNIGRNSSGVTVFPVTTESVNISRNSPFLQYEIYTYGKGTIELNTYFSPTLNFHGKQGMKCAISIDDEQPETIIINGNTDDPRSWNAWVANNIILKTTFHKINKPGKHIIKFWMIDSAIVLQKIVANLGGLQPSYLGPAETRFSKRKIKNITDQSY